MAIHPLELECLQLERLVQKHTANSRLEVKPYGKHLNIHVPLSDGSTETIARATDVGRGQFTAYFRNHTRKWEQLPIFGTLPEVAEGISDMLKPYLVEYGA